MDGMNQNNNNPYGQQDNGYQTNDPYQQNSGYQANDPYQHNPYQQQGNVYQQPDNTYQQSNIYQQPDNTYWQGNAYQQPGSPYQQQNYTSGQVVNPYNSRKNGFNFNKKIAIGIVCALVVVIGIGVGVLAYYRSTPSYKINKGFQNLAKELLQTGDPLTDKIGINDILEMMQEDGSHVQTKLDFTVDNAGFGKTTLGVDTDFYKDVDAKELNADTSISLMNFEFAHFSIYANDEVFCFSVPELFLEDIYIENEGVVSQYNDSIFGDIYPLDIEDRSINLFPDEKDGFSMKNVRSMSKSFGKLQDDINACRETMTIGKVEKGLYRVTYSQREVDRLLRNILKWYDQVLTYGSDGNQASDSISEIFDEYKKLITSDISLLYEIDGKNRIKSIMLEEPVKMLDGGASLEGELLFLGEARSIDKVQGKLTVNGFDGKSRAVIWQALLTSDDDLYRMDMDMELAQDGETFGKVKFIVDCDAVKDTFGITYSLKDDETEVSFVVESSIEDFEKGESVEIELERMELSYTSGSEDIGMFKISGDISVEPLKGNIKPSVKPETEFFEMSYADWISIIYQLNDAYGDILRSMYDELTDYIW